MGIQSDTEMLSVAAVEQYAAQNHMAVEDVYKRFYKYQIFEKIILQHEYLHQVSMDEVMEFIKENRSKGGLQHDYDVVIGPVADDNTMETVQLYMAGILNEDEAVNRLRYSKVNHQISFHTRKALEHLRLVGRERYEGDLHL